MLKISEVYLINSEEFLNYNEIAKRIEKQEKQNKTNKQSLTQYNNRSDSNIKRKKFNKKMYFKFS